jgi:hypothetical protein
MRAFASTAGIASNHRAIHRQPEARQALDHPGCSSRWRPAPPLGRSSLPAPLTEELADEGHLDLTWWRAILGGRRTRQRVIFQRSKGSLPSLGVAGDFEWGWLSSPLAFLGHAGPNRKPVQAK